MELSLPEYLEATMVTVLPHSRWKPSALGGPSQENSGKRAGKDMAAAWLVSNVICHKGRKHFCETEREKSTPVTNTQT